MESLPQRPSRLDAAILAIFAILITWQPYYLYGKVNIFELGLYLPGIDAIYRGLVPFRDFFHLRGPFELYMPALFMKFFGMNIPAIALYFYVGTILALLVCVFIAKNLYRTWWFFYLMVPVLIARTFPRVVFTFWGGMRYAVGLLALLCLVKFFKTRRMIWIFLAGLISAFAIFTSIEIGACAVAGSVSALIFSWFFEANTRADIKRASLQFFLGLASIVVPYTIYMVVTHSFIPYVEGTLAVVTNMTKIFNDGLVSNSPKNLPEILLALMPGSEHFDHFTPFYFYLIFCVYAIRKLKRKEVDPWLAALVGIAVYGLMMWATGLRNMGGAQFEMALQPEKILFFFILEEPYLFLCTKKQAMIEKAVTLGKTWLKVSWRYWGFIFFIFLCSFFSWLWAGYLYYYAHKIFIVLSIFACALLFVAVLGSTWGYAINRYGHRLIALKLIGIIFVFIALLGSSWGYAIERYSHRFISFKLARNFLLGRNSQDLQPLNGEPTRRLELSRAKGMIVPAAQAEEFERIIGFLEKNTKPDDTVFMYPELGFYNFLANRPFLGRFPMATFSWLHESWHEELVHDLKTQKPKYIILPQKLSDTWDEVYFVLQSNHRKYDEMMRLIHRDYDLDTRTPESLIYKRRETVLVKISE